MKLTKNMYTTVLTIQMSKPTSTNKPIFSGILFPISAPVIELERPKTPKCNPWLKSNSRWLSSKKLTKPAAEIAIIAVKNDNVANI